MGLSPALAKPAVWTKKWTVFNDDGFSYLFGGGLNLKITDKISIGAEVEWSPDVIDGNIKDIEARVDYLNKQPNLKIKNIGYHIAMDILLVSANVIYRF